MTTKNLDAPTRALEFLDRPALDTRVARARQVAHVVVHDDRQRAHRVNTPRKAELQARLAAAASSASRTPARRL